MIHYKPKSSDTDSIDDVQFPIGQRYSIVTLIDLYRSSLISEADVFAKLRGLGMTVKAALDYLDLVVGVQPKGLDA
jgi:hypothetical protein